MRNAAIKALCNARDWMSEPDTSLSPFLIAGIVALCVVLVLAGTCVMWMHMKSSSKPAKTGGYALMQRADLGA